MRMVADVPRGGRHLMALPLPDAPKVRILGVDDWSWKKERRYGTILVDLE